MINVSIEFTIRATPDRCLVDRQIVAIPRIGDFIEMSEDDMAEVHTVTWEYNGRIVVHAVSLSRQAELPKN